MGHYVKYKSYFFHNPILTQTCNLNEFQNNASKYKIEKRDKESEISKKCR
jgi:hypothetical protein